MRFIPDETAYYRPAYWFDNPEHDDCDNFGKQYYVCALYKHLIEYLRDIPSGNICVLGTNRAVSFRLLCAHFGDSRCIGYDIGNPTNDPRVIVRDCSGLGSGDRIPIAFGHNDVGSYVKTPRLKWHCQTWAASNTVMGGYLLSRNNRSRSPHNIEAFMKSAGFENIQLADAFRGRYIPELSENIICGHMLSKRIRYV